MPLINDNKLLVVALNSQRARFFNQSKRFSALQPITNITPDTIIKRNSEVDSDRQGRGFNRSGKGRYAIEPHTDSVEHSHAQFAKKVTQYTAKLLTNQRYTRLLVMSSSKLAGLIRQELTHNKSIEDVEYIITNPKNQTDEDLQALIADRYGVQRLSK